MIDVRGDTISHFLLPRIFSILLPSSLSLTLLFSFSFSFSVAV